MSPPGVSLVISQQASLQEQTVNNQLVTERKVPTWTHHEHTLLETFTTFFSKVELLYFTAQSCVDQPVLGGVNSGPNMCNILFNLTWSFIWFSDLVFLFQDYSIDEDAALQAALTLSLAENWQQLLLSATTSRQADASQMLRRIQKDRASCALIWRKLGKSELSPGDWLLLMRNSQPRALIHVH